MNAARNQVVNVQTSLAQRIKTWFGFEAGSARRPERRQAKFSLDRLETRQVLSGVDFTPAQTINLGQPR